MTARRRSERTKNISLPAHPKANSIIIAHIDGVEYRAYITHFMMTWVDPIYRDFDDIAWTLGFSYLISKKREKGLIAGWERKPNDKFLFEIVPANPNKYQQHQTYRGMAKFNTVWECKDVTPTEAHITLDIISKRIV